MENVFQNYRHKLLCFETKDENGGNSGNQIKIIPNFLLSKQIQKDSITQKLAGIQKNWGPYTPGSPELETLMRNKT